MNHNCLQSNQQFKLKYTMQLQQSYQSSYLQFSLQQLVKSKKTHYRQFTYNDSQALRSSMRQLWSQVYQYPQHQPLSNRNRTQNSQQQSDNHNTQNARQAWSVFDPEKEPVYQLDVFKAAKKRTQNAQNVQKQAYQKKTSGWGNLFKKQFWGQQYEKPPPFMGAFEHIQPDFGPNINISIPSRSQYNPYSQYLQNSRAESIVSPYNNLQYSKILGSQLQESRKQDEISKNRYFFECQSVKSEYQPSQAKMPDMEMKQSKIQQIQQELSHSVVWNYEALFGQSKPFKSVDPEWQSEQNKPIGKITNSEIFEIHKESNAKVIESFQLQLNLSYDVGNVLSDQFILTQISKMLQNVQCELFTLDYTTLTWKLDTVAYRPQYLFKGNSVGHVLEGVMEMASQRSRLSAAVNFLNRNKYRKIYSQLSVHIAQMLVVFEQIILQLVKQCTLVQFLSEVQKLKAEVELLYNLIINEEYIREENKLYQDFDFRFLHAEALIFKRIVKLARNSDAVLLQNKNLVNQLLQAAFSPLLFLLENLLFSQCPYLELNSELYLKYYFDEPKQIINSVSKKLQLIKQESNEMYLICKVKQKLSLVQTLRQLKRYEQRWEKSFKLKRKLIQRIKKQHKNKLKWDQQKKKEQKMKDILELKSRFFQTQQEEWIRKRNLAEKNKDQLQRLRKEIEQKQERRKLMEQLEKEKEKNILLDIQLKEKQKLAKEKQLLLQKLSNSGVKPQEPIVPSKQSINLESQSLIQDQNEKQLKLDSQIHVRQEQKIEKLQLKKQISLNFQKPLEQVPVNTFSQEIIPSQKSLEQLNRIYMQTAGGFFSKKEKEIGSKTESYFQLVQKPKKSQLQLQSEPQSDQSEPSQKQNESEQNSEMQIESQDQAEITLQDRQVDIQTCINICVDQVVRKQTQVVRKCLEFIIVDKYEIMQVLQYLRTIFMSGNGQKVQEFIRLCINNDGLVGLKHFTDCLLFDTPLENIQKLNPTFYHSKVNMRHAQINIFSDSIQHYIGFEFNSLPNILQPYFSYIHLSKYMQIFGFIIRLRHCSNLLSQSWKLLNSYKKQLDKKQRYGYEVEQEMKLMNSLCMVRYRISNFLKMFENYLFFRVIEKEYKTMRANITQLNDLELNHVKMLDNIIKYGFIDNPNQTISKNFRQLLIYINEFYQVVNKLALDDIASYEMQQVQKKVNFINVTFDKQLRNMDRKLFKLSDV